MNIVDVDLNLLKVFEALYEESSASRAALRLGVSQSAVSASLRRLRDVYGDALFMRTGRGLAPTLRANQLRPVIGEALAKCRQSRHPGFIG
jgi:LysR family transcriptional activator of mexEF-oprN operon